MKITKLVIIILFALPYIFAFEGSLTNNGFIEVSKEAFYQNNKTYSIRLGIRLIAEQPFEVLDIDFIDEVPPEFTLLSGTPLAKFSKATVSWQFNEYLIKFSDLEAFSLDETSKEFTLPSARIFFQRSTSGIKEYIDTKSVWITEELPIPEGRFKHLDILVFLGTIALPVFGAIYLIRNLNRKLQKKNQ
ncbi:hypothetical protein M0811_12387 [Anaeramoeba ignava]|uniref:Uncharacterized protein n=1 Tax=Anaeramoeba ignava TaxID=1746090 RepID=A0A9Q0L9E7_ANAIG|nr:hypothetical protein M0811_12387 [Anaeramoeba ignava]